MTTAQILVLGIGTTLGIAAQALVLVPALRRAGFRWRWRFRAQPERVRPDEGGRHRSPAGSSSTSSPARSASPVIQKVGVSNGGLHRVHPGRPALPDAVRDPGRLAADRDHAAAVAGRGARRERGGGRRPEPRRPALGDRARPGHRRADRARPAAVLHAVRARADLARRRPADRYRARRCRPSGCSRSRSSCCSCGCSTRCATARPRR